MSTVTKELSSQSATSSENYSSLKVTSFLNSAAALDKFFLEENGKSLGEILAILTFRKKNLVVLTKKIFSNIFFCT